LAEASLNAAAVMGCDLNGWLVSPIFTEPAVTFSAPPSGDSADGFFLCPGRQRGSQT